MHKPLYTYNIFSINSGLRLYKPCCALSFANISEVQDGRSKCFFCLDGSSKRCVHLYIPILGYNQFAGNNHNMIVIRQAIKEAMRDKIISSNPAEFVVMPKMQRRNIDFLLKVN